MEESHWCGWRPALDKVSFILFGLAEAWWALARWQGQVWPGDVLDRVEVVRLTCQTAAAVAGLLAWRPRLAAQEAVGLFWPGAGLFLAASEGVWRLWRSFVPSSSGDDNGDVPQIG